MSKYEEDPDGYYEDFELEYNRDLTPVDEHNYFLDIGCSFVLFIFLLI